jgi:PKD domain/Phosphate-induced protein 1 conserved region
MVSSHLKVAIVRRGLFVGTLTALALGASPAAALIVKTRSGARLGIVPAIHGSVQPLSPGTRTRATACASSCAQLVYHSGPVQHAEKEYLFFWAPSGRSLPSTYRSGLVTFIQEVAGRDYTGTDPFSVAQQYYDLSGPGGAKRFVPYAISYAGSVLDTHAYPASGCSDTDGINSLPVCLTQAQIVAELSSYITAHSLPTGLGVEYHVITPHGVGSCFDSQNTDCSYTSYCGLHTTTTVGGHPVLYTDLPWDYNTSGCDLNLAFSAGYSTGDALDPVVDVLSREISQSMSDPQLNAWYDASGLEAGDKCAYIYGTGGSGDMTGVPNNGLGYWNIAFGSDQYLLSRAFDNHTANCVGQSTFTQPTASVSPSTATHNVSRTFTASVTDPYGVAYIGWDFGDRTAPFNTTVTSTRHTYATAGTKTLTMIVTDHQGDTVRVVRTITVR